MTQFIIVHKDAKNEILLNVDSISSIQSVNDGRTTRIALGRGDDLFVSDKYDDIKIALLKLDVTTSDTIS